MPAFLGAQIAVALGASATGFLAQAIGAVLAAGAMFALNRLLAPKVPNRDRGDTRRPSPPVAVQPARWALGTARTGGVLAFFEQSKTRLKTREEFDRAGQQVPNRRPDVFGYAYETSPEGGTSLSGDDPSQDAWRVNDGSGKGGRDLWRAYAVSEGPCTGIGRMWVDGKEVEYTVRGNKISVGSRKYPDRDGKLDYTGRLFIYVYFKADGTEGEDIRDACSGFTNEHLGYGVSWIAVHANQNEWGNKASKRFWSREPGVELEVHGIQLTWPGQEELTWTNNAAALRRWFLMERKGVKPEVIDDVSFKSAFALSQEIVTFDLPDELEGYTNKLPRYTIDGVIDSDMDIEDIEAEMDYAWQGNVAEVGGILHFRPGGDRAISAAFSNEDLLLLDEVQTSQLLQDRINSATMTLYQSRDHDFEGYDVPLVQDEEIIARDEQFNLPQDLGERLFINSPIKAAWLIAVALRQARHNRRIKITTRPGPVYDPANAFAYWGLAPGDWVTLTNSEYGLVESLFQLESVTPNEDYSVTFILEEVAYGNFVEDFDLPPFKPRDIQIPGSDAIPMVDGLSLDEISTPAKDGTVHTILVCRWAAKPYLTELSLRRLRGIETQAIPPVIGSQATFSSIIVGQIYEVQARHVHPNGEEGEWSEWVRREISGDLTPPERVANFTHSSVIGGAVVSWDPALAEDYDKTQVFANEVENDFSRARLIGEISGTSYTHAGFTEIKRIHYWARHVDKSRNQGLLAQVSGDTGALPEPDEEGIEALVDKVIENNPATDLINTALEELRRLRTEATQAALDSRRWSTDSQASARAAELARSQAAGHATAANNSASDSESSAERSENGATASFRSSESASTSAANAAESITAASGWSKEAERHATVSGDHAETSQSYSESAGSSAENAEAGALAAAGSARDAASSADVSATHARSSESSSESSGSSARLAAAEAAAASACAFARVALLPADSEEFSEEVAWVSDTSAELAALRAHPAAASASAAASRALLPEDSDELSEERA